MPNGVTYLIESVDTSGCPYTAEYLSDVTKAAISKCKLEFGAIVHSFVANNAANVKKIRELPDDDNDMDLISYGCSATC